MLDHFILYFLDITKALEIYFRFFTPSQKEGRMELQPSQIAREYLQVNVAHSSPLKVHLEIRKNL